MFESSVELVSPAAVKASSTPGNASRRRRSGAADGEDAPESGAKPRGARASDRMQSESDMSNTNGVPKAKGRSARRASQEAVGDAAMYDAEQGAMEGDIGSVKQEGGTGQARGVHATDAGAGSCSVSSEEASRSQAIDPESLPCNKQPQGERITEEPEVEPQGDTNMADANIALENAGHTQAKFDQEDIVIKTIGDDTRHSPAEPPVAAVPAFAEIGDASASGPCEPSA
jgi:hypothetical protein